MSDQPNMSRRIVRLARSMRLFQLELMEALRSVAEVRVSPYANPYLKEVRFGIVSRCPTHRSRPRCDTNKAGERLQPDGYLLCPGDLLPGEENSFDHMMASLSESDKLAETIDLVKWCTRRVLERVWRGSEVRVDVIDYLTNDILKGVIEDLDRGVFGDDCPIDANELFREHVGRSLSGGTCPEPLPTLTTEQNWQGWLVATKAPWRTPPWAGRESAGRFAAVWLGVQFLLVKMLQRLPQVGGWGRMVLSSCEPETNMLESKPYNDEDQGSFDFEALRCMEKLLLKPANAQSRFHFEPLTNEPVPSEAMLGGRRDLQNPRSIGYVYCIWEDSNESKYGDIALAMKKVANLLQPLVATLSERLYAWTIAEETDRSRAYEHVRSWMNWFHGVKIGPAASRGPDMEFECGARMGTGPHVTVPIRFAGGMIRATIGTSPETSDDVEGYLRLLSTQVNLAISEIKEVDQFAELSARAEREATLRQSLNVHTAMAHELNAVMHKEFVDIPTTLMRKDAGAMDRVKEAWDAVAGVARIGYYFTKAQTAPAQQRRELVKRFLEPIWRLSGTPGMLERALRQVARTVYANVGSMVNLPELKKAANLIALDASAFGSCYILCAEPIRNLRHSEPGPGQWSLRFGIETGLVVELIHPIRRNAIRPPKSHTFDAIDQFLRIVDRNSLASVTMSHGVLTWRIQLGPEALRGDAQ